MLVSLLIKLKRWNISARWIVSKLKSGEKLVTRFAVPGFGGEETHRAIGRRGMAGNQLLTRTSLLPAGKTLKQSLGVSIDRLRSTTQRKFANLHEKPSDGRSKA